MVWPPVFEALAAEGDPPAEVLIDSTHVKAHRSAAGEKGGIPCDSGKYGSIRRICASDNPIGSLMTTPPQRSH